jgi:LemA protein
MYVIVIFNRLVFIRNNVKKSWANIDVLLKQRYDELPKLIETAKQYMQYERDTLEKITKARALAMQAREDQDIQSLNTAESILKSSLGKLFALAENYPELKASESFAHLQARISGLENSIADRRELYNETVMINNVRIEQFPDVIVALLFGFKHFDPLEYNKDSLADVDVNAAFNK